ncbi:MULTISPECIES: DUF1878 family protein [unclassified Bacillus (in: firmicutes)]|uniref:DUF1878 family protein n=1 Tax=unclassified Bacillus (in: firmicutes) TaxID=185979 RepID=UPI0008F097BD|nr:MULTISPECIES: DUF1878 family protein [unclassified Bacillus (in: firmicutes)]SFA79989.1 Protein of unknown function [Bacillus sp. UNCCL13]SFQ70048.1 Protein of unknown function [Bacillus sp. cl95]
MNERTVMQRLELLEYHQSLLMEMMTFSSDEFNKLIITKKLSKREVETFSSFCEKLSIEMQEQKAEGFVYFHPLFNEFKSILPRHIQAREMIEACLQQGLFTPLMAEFKKYLKS